MALVGKLDDIRPAEIMVYIGDSVKSGKLIFTTGTQEGLIVFREGKIIYAASSSIRIPFDCTCSKSVRLRSHVRRIVN